ncbi:hypothetical protein LPJ64_001061 [Coemansia asiatica]|uniref:Uncharacterized protein n=1 Tax=Coemansia asiatica TaxID=1052880 RepID=A0A9W7XRE9_9FUNG|nr:hypothetical protein LPJ64_001061 [Coemansia asiatica]KAJ2878256.1 hypothetical protein FB639_003447 [Coemansia asiatica]
MTDSNSTSSTGENRARSSSEDAKQAKMMEDPIMRDYVKKILGENAEPPADYASLIIESRRRGREGLPQPHLRPHRCDKHLQDFLDGIFQGGFWGPAKVYFRCIGSKQGEEPDRYKLQSSQGGT